LLPSLQQAQVLDHWVGLRPGRTRVRLALDQAPGAGGAAAPIIHNYGHGGSGLTLAWGCAGEAVQLARQALQL
jgi:glycine/D-amino acid oxidase-like deaminating enzyme